MLCGAAASPAVLLHPDAVERDGLHLHARLLCLPRHLDRQAFTDISYECICRTTEISLNIYVLVLAACNAEISLNIFEASRKFQRIDLWHCGNFPENTFSSKEIFLKYACGIAEISLNFYL